MSPTGTSPRGVTARTQFPVDSEQARAIAQPQDTPSRGTARVTRIWRDIKPYLGSRRQLALLATATVLAGLAQAGLLVLVGQLALAIGTDRAQTLGPLEDVGTGTLLLISFALAGGMVLFQTGAAAVSARMSAEALVQSRRRVTSAFLRSSWDLRSREREGRLQEHLSNHAYHISTAVLAFGTLLAASFNLAALTVAALIVNPLAAALIVVVGGLLSVVFRPLLKTLRRASARQVSANLKYAESVAESVRISQELVVFDVGDVYERRLAERGDAVTPWLFRARFLQRATPDWFRNAAFVMILVGLAVVDATGTARLASLTVIVLLLVRAVAYARELQTGLTRFQEVLPYIEDVSNAVTEYCDASQPLGGAPVTEAAVLELDRISYTYPGSHSRAVDDVSLVARRGEAIGIVGPSGSGKSTLFQLLLRLREAEDGAYLVDGVATRELELSSWYRRVALVHQDLQLVAGTMADNIRFFRPGISDEQVEDAARRAYVLDEILAMAHGLDTLVEGSTVGVSGGQRQRICLARALVDDPDVIFLDEPTSALDSRAEAAIARALEDVKAQAILFVISHRPSTLNACDRILVMGEGRAEAFGAPDELLRTNAFYRESIEHARGP